jgi:hypothetical protein
MYSPKIGVIELLKVVSITSLLAEIGRGQSPVVANVPRRQEQKKTDVAEHPEMLRHIGLLVNEPPGTAELPFI